MARPSCGLKHAGSISLTQVDLAMGIYSAASNVSDEQVVRVGDDLFRRLLSTWERREVLDEQGVALAKSDQASFYVTSPQLNLRSGRGMAFSASTVLNQNDPLTLLSERHSPWVEIELDGGQLSYVHQRYIAEF